MNWKDYIKSIQESDIVDGSLESIVTNLFSIAGCVGVLPTDTVKSWLYGRRKCKSSTYFPKGSIETEAVFHYFRSRPSDKLYDLQRIFASQKALDTSIPIDVKTTDLDIFCWSLVNQFLDLLKLGRVDIPQPKDNTPVRTELFPHDHKCCIYCSHWNGDRNIIGASRMPSSGYCLTHSGRRTRLHPCPSMTAACPRYEANLGLLHTMREYGYDIKNFI